MGEGEDTSLLRRHESGGGGKRYVSELENVVGVGMQAYWGDMKCGQSYVSGLKNGVCWVGDSGAIFRRRRASGELNFHK